MVEERLDLTGQEGACGKLLLTQEEWVVCMKQRQAELGTSGDHKPSGGDWRRNRRPIKKCTGGNKASSSRDISDNKCHNCKKVGHWARDCRKP